MKNYLEVFYAQNDLVRGAAERITIHLGEAILSRGVAALALSGGSTPRSVYELLGSAEYRSRLNWNKVHLFWGDERCVPPYRPESNFRMVNESLIKSLSIPSQNIHRIVAERPPAEAASAYEKEIIGIFDLKAGEFPEFDVILLGLGDDGHTASLFPGTAALQEQRRIVTEVYVEKLMAHRITVTLPVINHAANILFLVSGRSKAEILQQVLGGPPGLYPAQMVHPIAGSLSWLVDQEAGAQLQTVSRT